MVYLLLFGHSSLLYNYQYADKGSFLIIVIGKKYYLLLLIDWEKIEMTIYRMF